MGFGNLGLGVACTLCNIFQLLAWQNTKKNKNNRAQQTRWHVQLETVPKRTAKSAGHVYTNCRCGWSSWPLQICIMIATRPPTNQLTKQPSNQANKRAIPTDTVAETETVTSINGNHLTFAYLTLALPWSNLCRQPLLSFTTYQSDQKGLGSEDRTPLNGGFFCEFQYILNGLCHKRITTLVPKAYHYG